MSTKTIRAVVIDPKRRVVYETRLTVDEEGSAYDSLVDAIFQHSDSRGYIQHMSLGANVGMYCDEEGLLKDWDEQAFFRMGPPEADLTIAGVAVLVSDTPDGYSGDCELSLFIVQRAVTWLDPQDVDVPAPFMETMGKDGQIERTYLAGTPRWTYDNQPC